MGQSPSCGISVIIPALVGFDHDLISSLPRVALLTVPPTEALQNEESNIGAAVASARQCTGCEVIVVDGGSIDRTKILARRAGARVLSSPKGRARQLNAGAARASGDVLVFLHADSCLPASWEAGVHSALDTRQRQPAAEWGAFESIEIDVGIPGFPPTTWLLRHAVALRTRLLHRPYGDQALFVRRACFRQLQGFADLPLLEDLDLVQRLNCSCGRPAIVPTAIRTSGRRWRRLGLLRATLINQAILAGHALGVDVHTLAALYERTGHSGGAVKTT